MTTLYVFLAGPDGVGKSQFLYALGGDEGYGRDEEDGIEFRRLTVDEGLDVCLLCSIDPSRFDRLMQIPQRDLLGYIIMVDSTDPDSWGMARVMLANCRGYALLPTLIAANKQDLPGAYTPEQVGASIGIEPMMRVQGCIATNADSVRNTFLQLLYSVKNEIDRLDALIAEIERITAQDTNES